METMPWEKNYQNGSAEIVEDAPAGGSGEIMPWEKGYQAEFSRPYFIGNRKNEARLKAAFTENPLLAFPDFETQCAVELETARMDNPDEARKRYALAAYYTEKTGGDFNFVLHNLDGIMAKYHGAPKKVGDAFSEVAALYGSAPQKTDNPSLRGRIKQASTYFPVLIPQILAYDFAEKAAVQAHNLLGDSKKGVMRDESDQDDTKLIAGIKAIPNGLYQFGAKTAEGVRTAAMPFMQDDLEMIALQEDQTPDQAEYFRQRIESDRATIARWQAFEKGEFKGMPDAAVSPLLGFGFRYKNPQDEITRLQKQISVSEKMRAARIKEFKSRKSYLQEYRENMGGELKRVEREIQENSQKYHTSGTLGEHWDNGNAAGLIGESAAIIYDQICNSVIPQAVAHMTGGNLLAGAALAGSTLGDRALQVNDKGWTSERVLYSAAMWAAAETIPEYALGIGKILRKFGIKPKNVADAVKKSIWREAGKSGFSDVFGELITFVAEKVQDAFEGVNLPGGKVYEDLTPEERRSWFTAGLPETIIGSFGSAAPMAALGQYRQNKSIIEVDQIRQGVQNTLEAERERLAGIQERTEADDAALQRINTVLDGGNLNDRVAVAIDLEGQARRRADENAEAAVENPERYLGYTPDNETDGDAVLAARNARENNDNRKRLAHNPQDTMDKVAEMASFYRGIEVVSVESGDALPDGVRRDLSRRGKKTDRVRGVFYQNKIYVNAARVRPSEVPALLLHEVVGHAGLRKVFGADFDRFLDSVWENQADKSVFDEIAKGYHLDLKTEAGRREATEEFLARLVESKEGKKIEAGYVKQLWQQIRMWLAKLPGFKDVAFTDQEIKIAMARGLRAMRKRGGAAGGQTRFSIIGERGARQAITSLEAQDPKAWEMLGISGEMAARHAEAVTRLENLSTAKAMLAAGKAPKAVKIATGWEMGGDGKWRTETDDTAFRLLNSGVEELRAGETVRLDRLLESADLFAAYPDMREISVMQYSSLYANAMYHDNVIALSPKALESTATALHEIQHAIQEREGFAPGGSPGSIPDRMLQSESDQNRVGEIDTELKELNRTAAANAEREHTQFGIGWTDNPESLAVYDRIATLENERTGLMRRKTPKLEAYRRLGGEVEARNAAARRNMPLAERLQTLLAETEDVAEADKIYLDREVGAALMATDEDGNYFPAPDEWGTAYTSMSGKGYDAIQFLLDKKNGFVPAAFHREELGDIDVVYGQIGEGVKDQGGYGIAHIEKRRSGIDWKKVAEVIENGKIEPQSKDSALIMDGKGKIAVKLNWKGQKRKWVVSAMGNDLTLTADSLLASNPAEAAKQGIAPKGMGTLADVFPDVKSDSEKNPRFSLTDQTETLQFKKWFGKSKVVDADGKPKVLYHGTNADFTEFKKLFQRENVNYRPGFFFAETPEQARLYGDNIIPVYLKAEYNNRDAKKNGTTADHIHDAERGIWIVFEPTQIKSATDNIGTFDGNNPDIRFSLEDYSAAEQADFIAIMRPFVGSFMKKTPEEYLNFLHQQGCDQVDSAEDARYFAWAAIEENKKAARERGRQARDQWIYENVPFYAAAVDYAGNSNFKIKPSPRQKLQEHGTFISENEGIPSDALAREIARKTGEDELTVEDELIEFFKDLTKPELYRMYHTWKAEGVFRNKEEERAARAEWEAMQDTEAEAEALRVLEDGKAVDDLWLAENFRAFQKLHEKVFPGEKVPKEIGEVKLEALNAAITAKSVDAAETAREWQSARESAWNEYKAKLAEFKQKVLDSKADAVKLMREATSFAEANLKPEFRGEFTRKIIGLLDYSTLKSKAYPEGKRAAEFAKLLEEITGRAAEGRKTASIQEIRTMLAAHQTRRNYKGIPTSVLPDVQVAVNEIAKIIGLSDLALECMRNARLQEMQRDFASEEAREAAVADNMRSTLLIDLFGNLANKRPEDVQAARDYLKELIVSGKDKFRQAMQERLINLDKMRTAVIDGATFGSGDVDTTGKDARKHWTFTLKNRARLESLLFISSGKNINDFEKTLQADLVRRYNLAQEQEKTEMRKIDADFRAAVKSIFGLDGTLGFRQFLKIMNEETPHSGVFYDQYSAKIDSGNGSINLIGKRPAVRAETNGRIAELLVADAADPKTRATGYLKFAKNPENIRAMQEFLKPYGQLHTHCDLFVANGKIRAYSVNEESGGSEVFEAPLSAVPASAARYHGVSDLLHRNIARQLADWQAGYRPVIDEYGTPADDAQYQRLGEMDHPFGKISLAFDPANLSSKNAELENLTKNQALQLLLEYEQEHYKDAFAWNGFTAETIQQLYDFVGPEVLKFGYWMRDYVAKNTAKLDKVSQEKYGTKLPQYEKYWMGAFVGNAGQTVKDTGLGRNMGAMSMNPSFLIARRWHLKAPDLQTDAVGKFLDHMQSQAHFLALNDVVADLRGVFNNGKVKDAINANMGKNVTDDILRRIAELAHGGGTEGGGYGGALAARVNRAFIPAKLAFSLPSMLKQMAGAWAYMYHVPTVDFMKYHAAALAHTPEFREFAKNAWHSDYVQNRLSGGMNKDLVYMMNRTVDSGHFSVVNDLMMSYGMVPMKIGDVFATIYGGYAAYQYHKQKALADGFSAKEAESRGLYMWQKATEESQQSANITNQNYFMANQGWGRMMTVFLSNPIQTMDLVLETLDQARYGGAKPATLKKLGRRLMVSHVIVPALMFMVGEFWKKGIDFEEYDWEDLGVGMLFGSFEGIFLGKAVVAATKKITAIALDKPAWGSSVVDMVPVVSQLESVYRSAEKIFGSDELTEKELASGVQAFGDLLVAGGLIHEPTGQVGALISAVGMRAKQIIRWFDDK